MSKFLFYTWAILLFIISSIPKLPSAEPLELFQWELRWDYIFHFGAYALWASLFLMWKNNWFEMKVSKGTVMQLLVWGIAYACVEEGHQYFIPGRTLNPMDFFFDVCGLLIGLGTYGSLRPVLFRLFKISK